MQKQTLLSLARGTPTADSKRTEQVCQGSRERGRTERPKVNQDLWLQGRICEATKRERIVAGGREHDRIAGEGGGVPEQQTDVVDVGDAVHEQQSAARGSG